MRTEFDIAVTGSGFAGSIMAMIARRLGHSVIMIERGKHPRFAIGESSTPLANLLLEELANRYDLPGVRPLAKWGIWQRDLPGIGCGLKRGFTFLHHRSGQDDVESLMVAASPCDAIADTHWYRPELDHYLVTQAQSIGVEFVEQTNVRVTSRDSSGIELTMDSGQRIRAVLVIDASGPRGFLHRELGLEEIPFARFPKTQALFTHFRGVERWENLRPTNPRAPYPPDDAAVHHLFDGGWIWVLRFNNGLTSAGVAITDECAKELALHEGAPAWERLLARWPNVHARFRSAIPTAPWVHQPRLAFRTSQVVGENCLMLPSAAGVVDPLLSTGFPLTLLGVERLGRMLERGVTTEALTQYQSRTFAELDATALLVGALYSNLHDFEIFGDLTLLYFAAASFSESARRLNRPDLAASMLLHDHPVFGKKFRECCELATQPLRGSERARFADLVRRTIEPFDVAGLSRRERHPFYPALAADFLGAAGKLGATREEVAEALARVGFSES